jgi:hypothetical protein
MEASTLRGLRTGVIIVLLLALPIVALSESPAKVMSWLGSLRQLATAGGDAGRPVVDPTEPPAGSAQALQPAQAAPAQPPARDGLAPELDTAAIDTSNPDPADSASARVLRRPVYRPMADEAQLATIRRIPAEGDADAATSAEDQRQIDTVEEQLRQWSAANYRLVHNPATGDFSFIGTFDSPDAAPPRTFQATAPSRLRAMEQVLAQVQAWRGETRSGQRQRPDLR